MSSATWRNGLLGVTALGALCLGGCFFAHSSDSGGAAGTEEESGFGAMDAGSEGDGSDCEPSCEEDAGDEGGEEGDDDGEGMDDGGIDHEDAGGDTMWCEDYAPPPPRWAPCRSDADCEEGRLCFTPGEPSCPICIRERECESDDDCSGVCETYEPECSCGGTSTRCVDDCRTHRSDPCEDGFRCDHDTGLCDPIPCTGDYECPTNKRCGPPDVTLDAHGCRRLSCDRDADCDCGACVEGHCYGGPGTCRRPPA